MRMWKLKAFFTAALTVGSTIAAADLAPAAKSINQFGIELHRRITGPDENLCVSPYSIQTALAMTYAGADGATREEMARVLHFGKGNDIHASFGALQQALAQVREATATIAAQGKRRGGPSEPLVLKVANRLFAQQGFEFLPPFRSVLADTYSAPMEQLDFSAPAKAAKHINRWVEDQTNERIRDLVPPNALSATTRLVLVNAVYMKAPWANDFNDGATKPEPFHIRGDAPMPVPTMIQKSHYGYSKKDDYTALSIPYIGGDVHFLVVIPAEPSGLTALEKKLTGEELTQFAKLPATEFILHLPKFKMEPPAVSLKTPLMQMGMKTAFDEPRDSANFEKMATAKPGLFISEALHKTFIAVDEKGTEAAAATAIVMAPTSMVGKPVPPLEVKVDRPFLFAIQHRSSGACLFLGRVTDPR
jgi:serpin B